eukprot:5281025-Heterocapsa_arctica.AAC.1
MIGSSEDRHLDRDDWIPLRGWELAGKKVLVLSFLLFDRYCEVPSQIKDVRGAGEITYYDIVKDVR